MGQGGSAQEPVTNWARARLESGVAEKGTIYVPPGLQRRIFSSFYLTLICSKHGSPYTTDPGAHTPKHNPQIFLIYMADLIQSILYGWAEHPLRWVLGLLGGALALRVGRPQVTEPLKRESGEASQGPHEPL